MSIIIDRRLNGKNKSAVNRQRFIRRYKKHIKKAVSNAVNKRSITDITSGSDVTIPSKDLSEPIFHHGKGGKHGSIHPGNKEFISGDRIKRPPSGGGKGQGSGKASNKGDGVDEFTFHVNHNEFLELMFDNLELPNLRKKNLVKIPESAPKRAGFVSCGPPDRLNIIRSLRSAHARRIALSAGRRRNIRQLKRQLREMEVSPEIYSAEEKDKIKKRDFRT